MRPCSLSGNTRGRARTPPDTLRCSWMRSLASIMPGTGTTTLREVTSSGETLLGSWILTTPTATEGAPPVTSLTRMVWTSKCAIDPSPRVRGPSATIPSLKSMARRTLTERSQEISPRVKFALITGMIFLVGDMDGDVTALGPDSIIWFVTRAAWSERSRNLRRILRIMT